MTQPPITPDYRQPPQQGGNGMAIASLVLGIISCVTVCVWWVSIPTGVIALILGLLSRGRPQASGMAKAGLVLGIIGTVISLVLIILFVAGISFFGSRVRQEIERQQKLQQQQQQQQAPQTQSMAEPYLRLTVC